MCKRRCDKRFHSPTTVSGLPGDGRSWPSIACVTSAVRASFYLPSSPRHTTTCLRSRGLPERQERAARHVRAAIARRRRVQPSGERRRRRGSLCPRPSPPPPPPPPQPPPRRPPPPPPCARCARARSPSPRSWCASTPSSTPSPSPSAPPEATPAGVTTAGRATTVTRHTLLCCRAIIST